MPEPCTCTTCSMCRGRGSYYVDMRGRYVEFGDSLCDLEPCEECGGSGISEECGACMSQRELDEDAVF